MVSCNHMNETLPQSILSNTYSVNDAYHRIDMLQRALEHAFFEGGEQRQDRAAMVRAHYEGSDPESRMHAAAIAAWGEGVLDTVASDTLYARIQSLKEAVKASSKLTLYAPVHLTSEHIKWIGEWCRAELQRDMLLDLKVDPSAVGGCTLVYQNTFHDLSFTYFARKQREKLVQLVASYA